MIVHICDRCGLRSLDVLFAVGITVGVPGSEYPAVTAALCNKCVEAVTDLVRREARKYALATPDLLEVLAKGKQVRETVVLRPRGAGSETRGTNHARDD